MALRDRARSFARQLLRARGYDVVRYGHDPLGRVVSLMARTHAGVLLDVGANEGQYLRALRGAGYRGEVISFEPNPEAFARLSQSARGDTRWRGLPVALGAADGTAQLGVAASSVFSSLHHVRSGAERIDAGIRRVRELSVPVRALASLWSELGLATKRPFLKLDVQGAEREVLEGAAERLQECVGIQLELPFEPLYEGQAPLGQVVPELIARGFSVYGFFEGARDQASSALIEADVVLFNRRLSA